MNENHERGIFARGRKEEINDLPRRIAIGEAKLGATGLERLGAIKLGLACPARKNLVGWSGTARRD